VCKDEVRNEVSILPLHLGSAAIKPLEESSKDRLISTGWIKPAVFKSLKFIYNQA